MKQDFLDAVSSLVGRLMEDSIHTSAPSKVGKVENNHTAKLTPNLKVTTDDGREVPYPEISGTIILMPCGAGGTVGFAFPVKSDDGCLALFNEGGSGTDLKWDLSNAALLPGLYQSPGEQVKKAGSEEAAIMFAPSSTITVTKDKIEIKKDDTKITVTSDSIKMEKGSTTVTASTSSVDVASPSLSINNIDICNGVLLDRIGQLVCLTRQQAGTMIGSRELADNDDVYRICLKYKAYVNSCHCTPDEIIEATMIIFDATEVVYSERRDIPATIYLSVSAPFSDLVLAILGTHDLVVHPAGVKVRINCSTEDAETFGFTDLNPRVAGFGKGIFAQSIN